MERIGGLEIFGCSGHKIMAGEVTKKKKGKLERKITNFPLTDIG